MKNVIRILEKYVSQLLLGFCFVLAIGCSVDKDPIVKINAHDHVILIGNNLCSRMMNYGYFETGLQLMYPDSMLYIRNMCDGGDTPGFRPHSGRNTPWAFDGAEVYQTELANPSHSEGHLEYPDEWLTRHKADVIMAFFGYNESFKGPEGVDNYKNELAAFINHTHAQKYNGSTSPKLVLVSPIAFENLSQQYDLPIGERINANLKLYTAAMKEVAAAANVPFVDVFDDTYRMLSQSSQLTIDGSQLNDQGYRLFSEMIIDKVFGTRIADYGDKYTRAKEAVLEKNWFWHNDYKSPNGVHVFGRRYDPFGPDNYPYELKKLREMTANRDTAIWAVVDGTDYNLTAADQNTTVLPDVNSNYNTKVNSGNGSPEYLYGQDALQKIKVAPGYKIELFASEREFEDLANPVQLSFDNQGRLWVATMPTYPHWKPGDPKPNDKIIILEDTDGDGKADQQTTFVDGLHIPVGFEFAPEGVYVSQGTNLMLYTDTDGDDRADQEEIIMSGFDDHDTHHVISAFCADPSGALYMGEGVFLHTNVETSYGPVRATNGGFYRYSPQRHHLERTAQLSIPNPWGIAFDDWGQPIFAETSGPDVLWMLPGTVKSRYGQATHKGRNIIEDDHRVRPTSGLEFVSSRHFPEDVQGDLLINNTIGFLGMKQHQYMDDGTGFITKHRQDLIEGSDGNFRPVDMEFAPDGSLYVVDWHNVLIGHMQHNARDPYRDHVHGRIYRITYPSRPLVQPAKIVDASIVELLDNLKLPEYRTRYRTRRELRAREKSEVLSDLNKWVENLDSLSERYEHHLVEALWVTWGLNEVDADLVDILLDANNYKARAAAARVVRYAGHQLENQIELLKKAVLDEHGRVRMEAITAASWLGKEDGLGILNAAATKPMDDWIINAYQTAVSHLNGENVKRFKKKDLMSNHLEGEEWALYEKGFEIYNRDGYCGTCHQGDGEGLGASGFPPLSDTEWVTGDEERLIKLTLKGIYGPIKVLGKEYPGQVPMTPFGGLLNDEELAAVLTYVRNDWKNKASVILPETVKKIRASIKDKEGFYTPEELLREHPM